MTLKNISPDSFWWGAGIEDTFIPQAKPGMRPLEEYELTQHYQQWKEDLQRAASLGIKLLRWGIPWYRVNPSPGQFDWIWVDEVLNYMVNELKIEPVIDLLHYGTPLWMADSFVDPQYGQHVSDYARQFARHYGKLVRYYTAINEPMVNAEFCGMRGEWPPYLHGGQGFARVLLALARGEQLTIKAIREEDSDAIFVGVEAMRLTRALNDGAQAQARLEFHHDFLCFDLARGAVNESHPMFPLLSQSGVTPEELAALRQNPVEPDIFGVNFYPWSSLELVADAGGTVRRRNGPDHGRQIAEVLTAAHAYTGKPLIVTETSAPGTLTRRALWMAETIDAIKTVRAEGVPAIGYVWFPMLTMIGWEYRLSNEPIDKHLLHLGLWDAQFNNEGELLRLQTELVETYRDWVRRGMPVPIKMQRPSLKQSLQRLLSKFLRRP